MKIKKVYIEGFRSIKEPLIISFENVNALIGPNNSGKSNILLALYSVLGKNWVTKNTFSEQDVYKEQYDQDITIDIIFEEPYIYEQYIGFPIEIPRIQFIFTRYKIGENKGQRRLEKNCLQLNGKPVFGFAKRPAKGETPKLAPIASIPQDLQENLPVIYISASRSLKYQLPRSQNSLLGILMEDINKDFEDENNKIVVNQGTELEKEISRIDRFKECIAEAIKALRTEEFESLEKSIKINALQQLGFDPDTEADKLDLFFNPLTSLEFYKSLELYINEYDYSINATELGSGFQNAIVLAILKSFEERKRNGALFLIEEPEMYLHPQMQRSLYKTIRKIGETNQVIYVTHSPNFVTIPHFNEIAIVSKNENGTKIKKSTLNFTEELRNKYKKELNPARSEMFFAKKLLIVEGDTEKLAFPEFATRMGLDFDKVGGTIVEVGGKRNIIDFLELALSFEIPVAIAYDTDSSDFSGKKDEEQQYNEKLNSYAEKGVLIFSFEKNYENELKKFYGEQLYIDYCQKFGRNKTQRAKLMAQDNEIEVPNFVIPIIEWLG